MLFLLKIKRALKNFYLICSKKDLKRIYKRRKMDTLKKKLIHNSSRIVIKVGSSLLVNTKKNFINTKVLNNICKDINFLISQNKEILIVSSGALALDAKQ